MSEHIFTRRSVAYHEAGHAAFLLGSNLGETIEYVEVTPEHPHQKGITKTNLPGGERTSGDEYDQYMGRCLAGPVAQVEFVIESIPLPVRSDFGKQILVSMGEKELFDEVRTLEWSSDLESIIRLLEPALSGDEECSAATILACEENSALRPYSSAIKIESKVRKWMAAPSVRNLITDLAERLISETRVSGQQYLEILKQHPEVSGSVFKAGFQDDSSRFHEM
ncbi:hypothetical protein VSU19_10160 [Verrucomicrobiales bacterium BCK34]|nr:hypothetical protein [Verrucomicrobiales bacterium BCK34]